MPHLEDVVDPAHQPLGGPGGVRGRSVYLMMLVATTTDLYLIAETGGDNIG